MGFFKKAFRLTKKIGKKLTSRDTMHSIARGLGKINKYAIPILTMAGAVPIVGEGALGLAHGLSAAEKGINAANQIRDIIAPTGRSTGSTKSVESFHSPKTTNTDLTESITRGISKHLVGEARKQLSKIASEHISGEQAKELTNSLRSRIGNYGGDTSRQT